MNQIIYASLKLQKNMDPYFSLMYHLLVLFFQTAGSAFFAVAIRNSVKPGIGRKSYPYFVLNTIIFFIFANNSHLLCKGRKCQHRVLIVQALSEKATMAIWNMSANIILVVINDYSSIVNYSLSRLFAFFLSPILHSLRKVGEERQSPTCL